MLLLLFFFVFCRSGRCSDFESVVWPFFDKYCFECHDESSSKGGLDLFQAVDETISGRKAVEQWTQIFDRVDHGEMPPKKKARPDSREKEAFLAWIEPRLIQEDAVHREVVHRRLNRVEYENTIHDLLGISVKLKDLLPEDQSAGGFDNNGEALAISPGLFMRYMEAARRGLDHTIVKGARPETETFTADSRKELSPYLGKQFAKLGDHYFTFLRSRGSYSKISTRSRKTKLPGRYRIQFSARTVNSETPVVFSVVGFDDVKSENLGYFEVGNEVKEFEIEANLGARAAVQFFSLGLPVWVKQPKIENDAAIGFSSVTLTGPLYETWPPKQHTRLLGNKDAENGTLDDAQQIFEKLMPRAYRRPVDGDDVARPVKLVREALANGRSYEESLRLGLESILCSPNLLFLREEKTEKWIDDYELASRLSYFLWNSMPDSELFESARNGRLSEPATLRAQVDRMLQDHKSNRFVENFTGQWLKLREIEATTPDSKLYSEFDEVLQISMVDESHSFFRKLLDDDLPITNFIDSRFLMLNRRLARHYGIPGVEGLDVKSVDLPDDSVRGGVLTQAAVLKVTANGTNTSPVMRGVWVLENILGKHIPPPPPNIAGIEPDIREATTIREQLDLHRNAESCAGCHQYIDPPGFALESFDPIGGYRERYLQFKVNPQHADKGWGSVVKAKPVDASGIFANGDSFENIKQFKALLLANSDQFATCLTERLATYALGRELGFSDREPVRQIVEQTKAQGNGFRTLIKNLVTSPLFSQP